ncbi:hypothetical protein FisN_14Hh051 [Fistulifera solaris]|jgi:hypothetical protein|uniref:Potassium channel tetramerisation-type BTB domain-containing protein n=1 Tax=Fistulifera solaris TaxID=1519565 RepID=A0A1Z5K877_FISSO|nr:hypothetical protein FisN_14Hh051 [Fistulifera solaris]|eukprot:GAX22437.1 hypothetical protein FisN_14Hh051 [Fistulifera solaris]
MPRRKKQASLDGKTDNINTGIVRLNVGGTRYEAARLMRFEGSMLSNLISGKWKEGNGQNEIFLDRDGKLFAYILAYLRCNRVYVPDLSVQSALRDEFQYFGIDADMSKVSVTDDFVTINELSKEIKKSEKANLQKKKKIAAIKESYRLVGEFSVLAETLGLYLRHDIDDNVDKKLLRACLLSRGLHVVSYNTDSMPHTVDLCVIGLKDKFDKSGE